MGSELKSSGTESKGRTVCRFGLFSPQASLARTLKKSYEVIISMKTTYVWSHIQRMFFFFAYLVVWNSSWAAKTCVFLYSRSHLLDDERPHCQLQVRRDLITRWIMGKWRQPLLKTSGSVLLWGQMFESFSYKESMKMIHSFIDTVDKSLPLVANCDFSVNLNSEIFFALCCSQVKHFGFGNVWSTFIQNRTISRCFQFSGTSRVTLNVGRLQEFGVDLSTGHSFQTLLYGRSQIHVCLVDAGSLNHSKAGHHVNHLHTGIPVTTMVGQRLSLCAG